MGELKWKRDVCVGVRFEKLTKKPRWMVSKRYGNEGEKRKKIGSCKQHQFSTEMNSLSVTLITGNLFKNSI